MKYNHLFLSFSLFFLLFSSCLATSPNDGKKEGGNNTEIISVDREERLETKVDASTNDSANNELGERMNESLVEAPIIDMAFPYDFSKLTCERANQMLYQFVKDHTACKVDKDCTYFGIGSMCIEFDLLLFHNRATEKDRPFWRYMKSFYTWSGGRKCLKMWKWPELNKSGEPPVSTRFKVGCQKKKGVCGITWDEGKECHMNHDREP